MLRLLNEGDIQRAIECAKKEILLVGMDLDYAVGGHAQALMAAAKDRWVEITIFMVDPTSQLVQDVYAEEGFRNRLRDNPAHTFTKNRQIQESLRAMQRELSEARRWDRLKVYLYKYVTLYTALAVDASTDSPALIVSPHMYSTEAKYPPLIELTKSENPQLFELYWSDIKRFVDRVERRALTV